MVRGEINYQGLADGARVDLEKYPARNCVVFVEHTNKQTGTECNGPLRVCYKSWEEAKHSVAMRRTGAVGSTCTDCGNGVLLDTNKQTVRW